jgi:serine/threonine protein kinase
VPAEHAAAQPAGGDPLIGRLVDDALVVARLGQGGFGRVYLALQLPVFMKVALKLLDSGVLGDERREIALRTFEAEARALAALSHPNLVRLLRYGLFDDVPYLALEFVDGARTLDDEIDDRIAAGRGFSVDEVRALVDQALDGLAAAHAAQLVHRDVKPANIMLQQVPGHPRLVRLLDFGLAKDVSAGGDTDFLTGTPEFMAPEQIDQRGIGPWTDLYALAVIAFELLSGRKPFTGTTYEQIFYQKIDRKRDPAESLVVEGAPPAWIEFFRRALAREPSERFADTESFRAAFHQALVAGAALSAPGDAATDLSALVDRTSHTDVGAPRARRSPEQHRLELEQARSSAFRRWLAEEGQRLQAPKPAPERGLRPGAEPPAWDARNPLFGKKGEPPWEQTARRLSGQGRTRRFARRRRLLVVVGGLVAAAAAAGAWLWWTGT